MKNVPVVKVGIVAVSRDCFPESLAVNRRKAVIAEYEKKFGKDGIYECPICIVESEIHAQQALEDVQKAGCNALCVYLGNLFRYSLAVDSELLLIFRMKAHTEQQPQDRHDKTTIQHFF